MTVVSVHVPKAAGTSLFEAFKGAFGEASVQRIDDDPLDPLSLCRIDPSSYLETARRVGAPDGAAVLHGHFWARRFDFMPDAVKITVLRDPVERMLSHYFFWRHSRRRGHGLLDYVRDHELTIEQFARLPSIARIYGGVFFRDVDPASFDFIGNTGTLHAELPHLSTAVGRELVMPHVNESPEPEYSRELAAVHENTRLMERLREILAEDIAWYEHALRPRAQADTTPAFLTPPAGGSQYADPVKVERQVKQGEHRAVIGGMWDEIGRLAERFLIADGLRPDDRFLDVGCGSLRVGVRLVPYLDAGRYFGTDLNKPLLDAGFEREIIPLGLAGRLPRRNLAAISGFNVPFEGAFDVLLALSVFTHLPINDLRVFLERSVAATHPGSRIYVTYFPADRAGRLADAVNHHPGGVRTFGDRNPFHLRGGDLQYAADGLPFDLNIIGEWGHPRAQHMARYDRW